VRPLALAAAVAAMSAAQAAVNSRLLRRPPPNPTTATESVAVLLPVRNEAAHVGPCLLHLMDQRLVPRLTILLLDDCSTDDTAALAADVAAADGRVRVLTGAEPPAGWLGKPHACAQLAAACADADVLVFVDADVRLAPLAVASAVALLETLDVEAVCPFPRQLAESWAERIVQPLLMWSWLSLVPLRIAERSTRPSLAVATGQFLVVRRTAYDLAGGHEAARSEVMEDLALVRHVRQTGGRTAVVDGTGLAHCRMYIGWDELCPGYTKSLWAAFGSPAGAAAVFAASTAVYVVPALAALTGSRSGLLGYLFGVAGRAVTAHRTRARVWPDVFAHPASVATAGWLTVQSLWRHRRGQLTWKGRALALHVLLTICSDRAVPPRSTLAKKSLSRNGLTR